MLKRDWHQVSLDLRDMLEAMLHARGVHIGAQDLTLSSSFNQTCWAVSYSLALEPLRVSRVQQWLR